MPRGLDHIVHAVRDLDAAVALYARLGFQVGARNRHARAWGTENHIVQLSGTFVELLAMADIDGILPHDLRHFSFGAFNRDFLARREGLSMLVLEGRGAADAEQFRAAGIGDFVLYDLEREGRRPDGMPVKVAFTLTFASDPRMPDIGFFTCWHRHPENFWNPTFQVHANTATAVAGVALVAEDPNDHHDFISAFADARDGPATSSGMAIKTPRGEIEVMTPAAFANHFGVTPPPITDGARLAALRFRVRELSTVRAMLQAQEVRFAESTRRLIVGPDVAMGAVLTFEAGS